MSVALELKLGFGMGMDLQWSDLSRSIPRLLQFLKREGTDFQYFFFSIQPRAFDLLTNPKRIEDYFNLYDLLQENLPLAARNKMAFHHTFLNLASSDPSYPREAILEFTNRLVERYGALWINEDLGIWSLGKKMLPYPLPPLLEPEGLQACIRNIQFCAERLKCPLLVEFPGFTEGFNFSMGRMNAFSFFKTAIESTDAYCTLDTGHLLGYQYLLGNHGPRFLNDLEENLPFERCREIHLSGCSLVQGKCMDFHHGVILDEQLVLLDFLLERCPNLVGVTYEDPQFEQDGNLIPKAIRNYRRLNLRVGTWAQHG